MPTLARSCGAIVASLQATRRAIVPTASHVRAAPVCWSGVARAQPARCLNSHAPTSFPSSPLQQARALIQRPLEARSNAAASFHASAVSHKQVFVGTVVSDKPQKTGSVQPQHVLCAILRPLLFPARRADAALLHKIRHDGYAALRAAGAGICLPASKSSPNTNTAGWHHGVLFGV